MSTTGKVLIRLHGEIKTPPFSKQARIETGLLLRRLQEGDVLSLPQSRPMPSIGTRCHELRVRDETCTWRVIYRLDPDAILILDVFSKTTARTPSRVIDACKRRLVQYALVLSSLSRSR